MSQGDSKPDFSDVSRTVRSLLGLDVQETKAARAPSPQGTIGVVNGPVYFLGQVASSDLKEILATSSKQGGETGKV